MTHVLLVLCILLPALAWAQFTPVEIWARQFGGYDNDEANAVKATADGGFIIAGTTASFQADGTDMYVVKTDGMGMLRWQRTYGGDEDEEAFAVLEVLDGGYLVAGRTYSEGNGLSDVYVLRLDSLGVLLWSRAWGGAELDGATALLRTRDNHYALAGYTESSGAGERDMLLIKFTLAGSIIWQRTFGGMQWDIACSVKPCFDNGFVLAGYTTSFTQGWNDVYVVKTDSGGLLQWQRSYGGGGYDEAYAVAQTSDTGFVIVGGTNSFGSGGLDFYIVRTDTAGDTLWTRTFGGAAGERAYGVTELPDKGFVMAGYTHSFWPGEQAYLVKVDSMGDEVWDRAYGSTSDQSVSALARTNDNGFIVAGYTDQIGYMHDDFWVLRLGPDPNGSEEPASDLMPLPTSFSLAAYPNPFNPQTTLAFTLPHEGEVAVTVFDVTGRVVAMVVDEIKSAGEHAVVFDGSALPSGLYFAQLTAGDVVRIQKMVLLK